VHAQSSRKDDLAVIEKKKSRASHPHLDLVMPEVHSGTLDSNRR
jgi:hypothetical protein